MAPDLTAMGLELVLLGMGTVFAFLTLLVFVTSLMSRLIIRFSSAETLTPVPLSGDRPSWAIARHYSRGGSGRSAIPRWSSAVRD